jgi:hypothetical protein
MIEAAATRDYAGVWSGLFALVEDTNRDPEAGLGAGAVADLRAKIPPRILQYGGVLVTIAQAKTSDEIADAILAAASPADSWRAKYGHDAWGPVMLGGMLGPGADYLTSPLANRDRGRPRLMGGFGVDWIFASCTHFNVGVFTQLLDLGGYLQPDASGLANPRLLQAVSPGAALRIGLFGLPLALVGGYAYDFDHGYPIDPGESPQHPARGGRLFGVLAFDVPLFVLAH